MFAPGRAALLRDPAAAEALQRVAAEGWEEEARMHAQAALAALSDRRPDAAHGRAAGSKHVIVSYQWDVQGLVRRIVNELQARGYRTWFGARSVPRPHRTVPFPQIVPTHGRSAH
jgi:hypothetical protein